LRGSLVISGAEILIVEISMLRLGGESPCVLIRLDLTASQRGDLLQPNEKESTPMPETRRATRTRHHIFLPKLPVILDPKETKAACVLNRFQERSRRNHYCVCLRACRSVCEKK
jgi:hypothetical protein